MDKIKLEAILDICNILPSNLFEQTIKILSKVDSHLSNTVLINKEGPLKTRFDTEEKKYFLVNMFNKEKDSYRSPYSNMYFPENLTNCFFPSEPLRNLEILCNEVFERYRKAYYINGLSSVYLWPNPVDEGFVGAFLIKKKEDYDESTSITWEATHITQVCITQLMIHYQISSTINFIITKKNETTLSGCIVKTLENPKKILDMNKLKDKMFHIENIGKMIETIENSLRKSVEYIYISKINDILNCTRFSDLIPNTNYDEKMNKLQKLCSVVGSTRFIVQDELKGVMKNKVLGMEEYSFNA